MRESKSGNALAMLTNSGLASIIAEENRDEMLGRALLLVASGRLTDAVIPILLLICSSPDVMIAHADPIGNKI